MWPGQDIEIAVRDGGTLLQRQRSRKLRLPDGRVGAVWRGLVYPLNDANEIDILGDAFPPSACRPHDTALPPTFAFASLQGADEAYLLLAGPAAVQDEAAARLRAAGLTVLRAGRYLGEPVDGLAADWFIRFVRPDGAERVDALLARLFDVPPGPTARAAGSAAALRLRLLQDELLQSRAREDRLRAELRDVRSGIADQTQAAAALAALRDELAEERERRHAAEIALTAAASAPAPEAARPVTARPIPPRPRIADEIAAVLETLLPPIELVRDSLAVAAAEYDSRKSLYRALAELSGVEGRMPANWKAVKSAAGWWERHVSNGQDDTGRVYARQFASERRWHVLISDKGEQSRDIDWLRSKSKS